MINQIIKKAVERLKNEGTLLTPEAYAEVFCEEAKRAGILVEDCDHVDKFMYTLDQKLQDEVKQYHIGTSQELIRFLISRINQMQPSRCAELLSAHIALGKRILQAIDLLHNSEASALAKKTIFLMDKQSTFQQLEHQRQAWIDFITLYDDAFLQKLASYGHINTNDLKETIEHLDINDASSIVLSDMDNIASLMIASLVPSIASSANDDIAELCENLRDEPQLMISKAMTEEIREAIRLRIDLDKESLKEMVVAFDKVLDKLSLQLIDLIERSDSSTIEIQLIKKELESFEEYKDSDFQTAHRKLYTVALALEENTEQLSSSFKEHSETVSTLGRRISALEKELHAAQQASHEDFLTKLYNKRALNEQLKIKEGEYQRYDRTYSVIMFDLDHFKTVNDTYGHDAGDAVLKAFAQILKKQSRTVDIIGRFGGEEFMALLSNTDLKGGLVFARKVIEHVRKTRFVYKGERVNVTVSAGVAERKAFSSMKEVLGASDERLYDAKKNGRNRAEPQA